MERWDDLKIFLAVFRAGSCASAAEQLGINQSTVSRRLAKLEDALGVRLFDRVPEGLLTVAAAEEIFPLAELVEATIQKLTTTVSGRDQSMGGVVRVALPELLATELVAPRLPQLLAKFPALSVELATGDAITDLGRREADLALRFQRPNHGDLVVKRVAILHFGVFGSQAYLRGQQRVVPADLDWLDWDTGQEHLPAAGWMRDFFPHVKPVLRTTSLAVRLSALRSGLGVGIVAIALAQRYPELVKIQGIPDPPALPVWLVGHRALRDLPRVKIVWAFLENCCEELDL